MEEQGFANIDLMPNCKPLKILDEIELNDKKPHQLCTFSRVMKEKGIDVTYIKDFSEIENFVKKNCTTDDLLITMGAGDVVNIGQNLVLK